MRILPFCHEALLCFLVSLLFAASFCHGKDNAVEVVGIGECADCAYNKIETSNAFSGLHVTIDCKIRDGVFKTRGGGELDGEGKFKASLPAEMLKDGELKEECFAQLHSASASPCPAQNGLESSRIVFKSLTTGKHTLGPSGNLKFSPVTCTSALLWPPLVPIYKPKLPFLNKPPIPKILPPPIPIYKKPLPPPFPFYKPKPPFFKKPSFPKILPPPFPIYKKPLPPPPFPFYKPKPPSFKKPPFPKILPPPFPIYKKPLHPPFPFHMPKPALFKKPKIPKILPPPIPIYKKPLPPHVPIYIPKPPIYKTIPPFPKIPHKHPKFGHFPPMPPYSHNP